MKRFQFLIEHYLIFFIIIILTFVISSSYLDQEKISLFPLTHYDQTISTWINPNDKNYNTPLLTEEVQQKRFEQFYSHLFGDLSPWNENYVKRIIQGAHQDNLKNMEKKCLINFSNENKSGHEIGYGENFHPYTKEWIARIADNINLHQFDKLNYQIKNRGIAIDNLPARALPTNDVYFYDYRVAGQGYPFDNLQVSALWAGTPVYILAETQDHAWMLVISPDYIAWVKSNGIARVSNSFVAIWSQAAKKNLVAITRTQTPLIDKQGNFLFLSYVGSVFPGKLNAKNEMELMIPVRDVNHDAAIKDVMVAKDIITIMPLNATPHHFAAIMNSMIDRPYGWGSTYFYNDCSAELKSLFTPFGIWLPRHSSDQTTAGKTVDMSWATPQQRLTYLMKNGKAFLTIIFNGGHVILYIGNYPNPYQPSSRMAMTYQNLWGLSPNPATKRTVIGKSVLFPILLQYPEDTYLVSPAAKKYFKVIYLDQLKESDAKEMDVKLLLSTS